jgi:F0F1-type ATP synthase membrane subunit b/b'
MSKSQKKEATSSKVSDSEHQLLEIRRLLFGQEVTALNQLIETMQHQFDQQIQQMTQYFEKEMTEMSQEFQKELSKLSDKHQDLSLQTDEFHHEFDQAVSSIHTDIDSSTNDSVKHLKDAQQTIQTQLDHMSKQLQEKHQIALDKIAQTANELSDNKADRKTLASLLATMANNLEA